MGNLCSNTNTDATADAGSLKRHENINVAEFLSVCVYLSEECGKVIRQVEESGDLKT